MKDIEKIDEMIRELPPELRQEVEDFVQFLLEKRLKKLRGKPNFNWAGALKDIRDQCTSVELQHKISEWRMGEK